MRKLLVDWEEKFEFRNIRREEAEAAAELETICFPPNEACAREVMIARVVHLPEGFLVAVNRKNGRIAGFMDGITTGEESFRDEFFTDIRLHDAAGKNVMILGLEVRPEYRGQGLAGELMRRYVKREAARGRRQLILTCLDSKVPMYEKMGFQRLGLSHSEWGGERWVEMSRSCLTEKS